MFELKKTKLDLRSHIRVNKELCPVIFKDEQALFGTVQAGFMRIADFWWHQAKKIFGRYEVKDFVFYGDLAGYVYNRFNEVCLGVIVDLPESVLPYLPAINRAMVANEFHYNFINRPVHCRLLAAAQKGEPCYSLAAKQWITPPQRREFSFGMRGFCRVFPMYQNDIHAYVEAQQKHNNNLLTIEGCRLAEEFLNLFEAKALEAKAQDTEHEYCLDYLLWRTFEEIGGVRYFKKYLADSYNYNLNELEQC